MNAMETLDNSVFIDKSAFQAYINPDDPNHEKAYTYFLELDDLDRRFTTTNVVIFSIHQWLRDQFGYMYAEFFLNVVDKSVHKGKLSIIPGTPELEERARQFLLQCADYEITLEEALNAVVVSDYRIRRILTFNPKYSIMQKMDANVRTIPTVTVS